MINYAEANIARAVGLEVGALDGALSAIIVRVEYVALANPAADDLHDLSVFVLNREQAVDLQRQLNAALGWLRPPAAGH